MVIFLSSKVLKTFGTGVANLNLVSSVSPEQNKFGNDEYRAVAKSDKWTVPFLLWLKFG